jgi:hypothetical protein
MLTPISRFRGDRVVHTRSGPSPVPKGLILVASIIVLLVLEGRRVRGLLPGMDGFIEESHRLVEGIKCNQHTMCWIDEEYE